MPDGPFPLSSEYTYNNSNALFQIPDQEYYSTCSFPALQAAECLPSFLPNGSPKWDFSVSLRALILYPDITGRSRMSTRHLEEWPCVFLIW